MMIDISQEVFSCNVFPGDPVPKRTELSKITDGEVCNLTAISMCAHNGTHVDAPYHFYRYGKTIDQMGLEPFVGPCYVAEHEGEILREDAARMLEEASRAGAGSRILVKGKAFVSAEAARVFADARLLLFGNESQTVGPEDAPMEVHLILLGAEMVLLEGIVLKDVEKGKYVLSAAPLNLGGSDGAPCRAYLIRD